MEIKIKTENLPREREEELLASVVKSALIWGRLNFFNRSSGNAILRVRGKEGEK